MSQWTYARIDLLDSSIAHCIFCNRALKSAKAVILADSDGNEAVAGATCAKKVLGKPAFQLIDHSKLAMLVVISGPEQDLPPSATSGRLGAKKPASATRDQVDPEVEYLRLRVEALAGFAGNVTQRLRALYDGMLAARKLDADGRRYVEHLMTKTSVECSIYALANVKRCVAIAYWLRVAIKHTPQGKRAFLQGLDDQLKEKWRLTSGQIEALNKWGSRIKHSKLQFPVLDAAAFADVKTPYFVAASKER